MASSMVRLGTAEGCVRSRATLLGSQAWHAGEARRGEIRGRGCVHRRRRIGHLPLPDDRRAPDVRRLGVRGLRAEAL